MPRSFFGYDPDISVRTLDLEQAEQYFREAFGGQLWDEGFEFTALYNEGNTVRQTALQIMAENLSFLNPNFRMNVRGLPWADYLARTGEKKAPMFALGWGADYADPKNFIDTFYSDTGFYSARTAINEPQMQTLINEANSTTDQDARAELYNQIGELHYELAPAHRDSRANALPGRARRSRGCLLQPDAECCDAVPLERHLQELSVLR